MGVMPRPSGQVFSIFLTDDMGVFDQIWQESWDFQEKVEWDGKTILPQEMGRPRWEVAGNKTGKRIYHR